MSDSQPAILADVPAHARYIECHVAPDADPKGALRELAGRDLPAHVVVGLGPALVQGQGKTVDGLRPFPAISGPGCPVPSTQADLWLWITGDDRGQIVHDGRLLAEILEPAFLAGRIVDGFKYDSGLDLTGYEDGTENPVGAAAAAAAIVGDGPLAGSSFVAVQQWVHDLDHFESLAQGARDHIIGRRLSDNEELDDAPSSAHVKRTAQESFDPEAFVVRRSMPWADDGGEGLMFVAFGLSLDAFEAQLKRMTGQDDGVVDGLFRFTRPISGSYFWCPPVTDGRLNLTALGM